MVVETEIVPFFEWLPAGLGGWLLVVFSVAAVGVLIGWLVVSLRQGPLVGLRKVGRVLAAVPADLTLISPRRVFALSWLAVKESIRRRVLVVFAVFIVILLFAGWFLDPASAHPARLYLNFVLTATSYLVLLLALFLSAMSLPTDIKNKTLHTVVTKPVRHSEIVLGRILGFAAVGTVLLVIMGAVSYVFVIRGLSHTHEVTDADWRQGRTSRTHEHRHEIVKHGSATASIEAAHGHWHDLKIDRSGNETKYRLGPPRGRLVARVPIYSRRIRFKDPAGRDAETGVNVGDEWTYRSFIRGGSPAAAIWTFEGITEDNFPPSQFPNGIPLEMTLEVFRTYKGKTDDPEDIPGVLGSLAVRATTEKIVQLEAVLKKVRQLRDSYEVPQDTDEAAQSEWTRYQRGMGRIQAQLDKLRAALPAPVDVKIFKAKDFVTDVHYIPFKDLAPDGRMEVWLQCLDRMQYFGVARADVYIRARDASFAANLAKGYLGIWLQMLSVIGVGVMFSTFLSGPIAILATAGAVAPKLFCPQLLSNLASGEAIGGGPLEALYRLVIQQNLISPLEPGLRTTMIELLDDNVFRHVMKVAVAVLPEFGIFHFSDYVAYGFDISGNLVAQCALSALAMLLPVSVAAYLFLKLREVAK